MAPELDTTSLSVYEAATVAKPSARYLLSTSQLEVTVGARPSGAHPRRPDAGASSPAGNATRERSATPVSKARVPRRLCAGMAGLRARRRGLVVQRARAVATVRYSSSRAGRRVWPRRRHRDQRAWMDPRRRAGLPSRLPARRRSGSRARVHSRGDRIARHAVGGDTWSARATRVASLGDARTRRSLQLAAFHREVLRTGSVPLPVLGEHLEHWIWELKNPPAPPLGGVPR